MGAIMPNWIKPTAWQCPHCDFKAKNFDELMEHAKEVGLPFFNALDIARILNRR